MAARVESIAFAEALLQAARGRPVSDGTRLVFLEAMQMHGRKITVATDNECYVDALVMYLVAMSRILGESFKGIVAVAPPHDIPYLMNQTFGNRSFRDILKQVGISVVKIKDPWALTETLTLKHGLAVIGDDDLIMVYHSIPRLACVEPRCVARLGNLEMSTFPCLLMVYPPSARF